MHSLLDPILNFIHGDGLLILPQLELLLFALGILAFDFLLEPHEKRFNAYLAVAGVTASALGLYMQYTKYDATYSTAPDNASILGFRNILIIDGFTLFFSALFLVATSVVILISIRYLDPHPDRSGKYFASLLFACIAVMFMTSGLDLILLLLGLEAMAFSVFFLTRCLRGGSPSIFATRLTFLGPLSTLVLACGFFLLYRAGGSTNIILIGESLDSRFRYSHAHGSADRLVLFALITVVAGLLCKLFTVLFRGSGSIEIKSTNATTYALAPLSAFVCIAPFAAVFALLLRLLLTVFSASQSVWHTFLAGVAVALLLWGNLAALTQTKLRLDRFLVYACVSQAGYMLLAVVAWNANGFIAIFYFLIACLFTTAGLVATLVAAENRAGAIVCADDLDGLYQRRPALALMLVFLVPSLAGVPPTAIFWGKYLIIKALLETHHRILAAVAVVFLILAVFNGYRVARHVWRNRPSTETPPEPLADAAPVEPPLGAELDPNLPVSTPLAPAPTISNAELFALILTAFVTLAAGLHPQPYIHLVRYALGLTNGSGQ